MLYLDILYPMSFFCSRKYSGYISFSCHVSLEFCRRWQCLRLPLFLMTFTSKLEVFCRMSFDLDLSDNFLMIRLGVLGRKLFTEVKCHSCHIRSQVKISNETCQCWFWPWSPGRGGIVRFFHCKMTLLAPFPHSGLWKEVTMHSST